MERILIIKLGALGDFIHAFHAFAAIRAHHPGSVVTLLTTRPYQAMAKAAPWFNAVLLDARAPWWNLSAASRTAAMIRGFDFVYDLQTSRRSGRYHRLAGRPPWSGIAAGCSHPHRNSSRDAMHTVERQREQLAYAGVGSGPGPEREWLIRSGHRHGVAPPYALLMPGGAGVGNIKRWPAACYGEVAQSLAAGAITPVIIGGIAEAETARIILEACPVAVDLTGQTSFGDIAALATSAVLVLGNDTGPVHVACSVGAPTIALFSPASIRQQAAPRGPNGEWAIVLQGMNLHNLTVARVMQAIAALIGQLGVPAPA